MKHFIAGQKAKVSDLTGSQALTVGLRINFNNSIAVDFSCFGVDSEGQLSDDRYMIFFNQKNSPCESLKIVNAQGADAATFKINLAGIPNNIKKLVFTATLDGAETMSQVRSGYLRVADDANDLLKFDFDGTQFKQEKALIVGELYFKEIWRFGAVGQGFNGGLSALLAHFGGEEMTETPSSAVIPSPTPVRLSKITLEKKGDKQTISLAKVTTPQKIHINLNWDAGQAKKGLFGMPSQAPDLDLGCMYRMMDGTTGVIQPLGKFLGHKDSTPYILLDKDDRDGQASDGENLTIYRPDLIEFMIIFALIYKGAPDFSAVNGRLTIKDFSGMETFIKLDAPDPKAKFCVAASFKKNGSNFDLIKEEKYFKSGHKAADEHYGFGFKWATGRK